MGPARRWLLAVLVCTAASARAEDAPPTSSQSNSEPQPEPKKRHLRYFAIPNASFDTDDGLGFGARGELAIEEPGYSPYKMAFVLHAFATLRGYQHHRFRFDATGLGPKHNLRFTMHVAWRQWLNDGYWGIGNTTARLRSMVADDIQDGDVRVKFYRYSLFQPFLHSTLRAKLNGGFEAFTSLDIKYSVIKTYQGSLLAAERPFGIDGGLGVIATGGIIYDTRKPEVNPRSGIMAELSARVSAPGGAGTFGGPFFSIRGFVTPTPRLTIAFRFVMEALFGQVPFYEMVHWGGSVPITGFGGFETLRGIAFGRWHSPGKAVFNTELRIKLGEHKLFKRSFQWQLGLFGDVGMTFYAPDSTASGGPPFHPGAGAGLRLIFDELFVARIDTAVGLDPIREANGQITNEGTLGFFIVFDQAF